MNRFAVDSSCMIAAVCSWHAQHEPAARAIERRLKRGEQLTVAAHALVETYAVLTRLPAPHRLAPRDAWRLVDANFIAAATVVTIDADTHVALLRRLAGAGVGGGRSYDGVIGECARQGKAAALLTLNPRHFQPPPPGIDIEDPS